MSKFDELYPHANVYDHILFEGTELICGQGTQPCWHCQTPTLWFDINFGASLCSEECERAKWKEFMVAYNQGR